MTKEDAVAIYDETASNERGRLYDEMPRPGDAAQCRLVVAEAHALALLAVATEAARRSLTAALLAVENAEGHLCDAYWDVEKLLLAAGGTVPNWDEEDA